MSQECWKNTLVGMSREYSDFFLKCYTLPVLRILPIGTLNIPGFQYLCL